MNISGSATAGFSGDEQITASLQTARNAIARSVTRNFTNGTAAQQCDLMWAKSYTVAASSSTTITVSALTDDLGRAVPFVRVKYLQIESDATTTGDDLVVGAAASHPWIEIVGGSGQTFPVKPYGFEAKAAFGAVGYPVTPGSSDQLKFANAGANSITFRVTLAGCSA
jgi:hypothetical protein